MYRLLIAKCRHAETSPFDLYSSDTTTSIITAFILPGDISADTINVELREAIEAVYDIEIDDNKQNFEEKLDAVDINS